MTARQLAGVAIVSGMVSAVVGFGLGQATSPDVATAARSAAKSQLKEIRHLAKHNGRVLMRLERRIGETPKHARALAEELELARFDLGRAVDLAYFACSNTGDPDPCTEIKTRPGPFR